jgi:hypothetical protein
MNPRLIPFAILALALAGCSQQGSDASHTATGATPAAATSTAPAGETAAPAAKPKVRATPQDIARIEASGKTGFWADITEACSKGRPPATTLYWNVKASGAEKVVLFVADKKNGERHFGNGGPVGERGPGPWLRPDLVFHLRDAASKAELGTITIGKKDC